MSIITKELLISAKLHLFELKLLNMAKTKREVRLAIKRCEKAEDRLRSAIDQAEKGTA